MTHAPMPSAGPSKQSPIHGRKLPRLSVLVAFLCAGISPAEPVVPGLHGNHPLDDRQRGELLIGELRCAACHDGLPVGPMKEAPSLADAGARLTSEFMERFIADPAAVHHGTTMPGLLGAEPEQKRRQVAADIATYLFSLTGAAPEWPTDEVDPNAGKELFHTVGCVACHSPRDEAMREVVRDGVDSLNHLPGKHQPGALAAFLHEPLKIRPSGRMPDMKLSKQEAVSIAAYLEGEATPSPPRPPVAADRIAAGRRAFHAYNCAACHQPEEKTLERSAGPPLAQVNAARGCLSDNPGSAPDFKLSNAQRDSIRMALPRPVDPPTPDTRIKTHLTRLNCIACHERDDFGGVSPSLDSFFHSTQESLGNESRIPPQLTLVGAKLRPEWLRKVLYDGEIVRPYMTTRMPQFGTGGLADLAELFAEVDMMDPVDLAPPGREEEPEMRNGAHFLLGDQGLNCIACHNYNGKESPGLKGLDLMTSYQRLEPAWFYEFMKNPAKFRPGIIMPSYWPDGEALQTATLDGDADRQLRALWDTFSLGRSARDPSGLRSEPSILKVTDSPVTYRGRSHVAGYRGIAVGFPGGMNYAFNAEYGSLGAIWQGDYIRVGWQGQGSGEFSPIGRHLQLSQDVAFLPGTEPPAVWPAHPVTTKENPVNPDPLYPRHHGYAFLGYFLDPTTSVPTFQYRCGEVTIEDTTQSGPKALTRTLTFTAPREMTIWFRALTGEIEQKSATDYRTAELRITSGSETTILRPAPSGPSELLIRFDLPQGKTHALVHYELLR